MATDFFDQQQDAHRQTGRLLALFVLAVIAIVAAVYLTVTAIVFVGNRNNLHAATPIFDVGRLVLVATFILSVIVAGSLYKIATLQEGGEAVARLLGGELVPTGTIDLAERRLLNVVEEMAIASGTPVPTVYLLRNEPGINAFAAGFGPGNAVVAVSQGCLNHLTRDELQGVIGHEFSHILNGDMRLNLRLIGLLHGILLIGLIGYAILRVSGNSSGDKKDGAGALLAFGVGLLVIGYVGLFFGRLIKAAVSRQREFLADSSSVQFTRNPEGIAGALKKIGGLAEGSHVASPNAEQACHMFFGQGVSAWMDALATHPPLAVRIKRIDPSFDGVFPRIASNEVIGTEEAEATDEITFEDDAEHRPEFLRRATMTAIAAGGAVASVGAPTEEHIEYATTLLASLPDALIAAAREPFGARTVVYALLIDPDPSVRQAQFQHLDAFAWPGTTAEVRRLLPLVAPLGPETYLPLVDLALPALRQLSPSQYASFRANVDPLAGADRHISLFEFALERVLLRHLDQHFQRRPPARVRYDSLAPLLDACSVVLSALARVGQQSADEAVRAYQQGLAALGAGGPPLRALKQCALSAVNQALDQLAAASPRIKKQVLDACSACIASDGVVSVAEGELLRAIADSLDCPMPPLLGGVNAQAGRREHL